MSANNSYTKVLHPSKVIHRDKFSELIYVDCEMVFLIQPSFVVFDRMAVNGRLGSIKEFVQDYCLKAITNGKLLVITSDHDANEMIVSLAEQAFHAFGFEDNSEYIMHFNDDLSEEHMERLDGVAYYSQGYLPSAYWLESYQSKPDPGLLLKYKADNRYRYINHLHRHSELSKLRFKTLNKTISKDIIPSSVVDIVGESQYRILEKWRIPLFNDYELYHLDDLTKSLLFNNKSRSRQIGILQFFGKRFCSLSIESIDYRLNRRAIAQFSNVFSQEVYH